MPCKNSALRYRFRVVDVDGVVNEVAAFKGDDEVLPLRLTSARRALAAMPRSSRAATTRSMALSSMELLRRPSSK